MKKGTKKRKYKQKRRKKERKKERKSYWKKRKIQMDKKKRKERKKTEQRGKGNKNIFTWEFFVKWNQIIFRKKFDSSLKFQKNFTKDFLWKKIPKGILCKMNPDQN